jgi:hypothetical protein
LKIKAGESLIIGDIVSFDQGRVYRARAENWHDTIGVATSDVDINQFVEVAISGEVYGVFGLYWYVQGRNIADLIARLEQAQAKLYGRAR